MQLLKENGIEPEIIEYMKTPPDVNKLNELSKMMGLRPKEFVRQNEREFKENNLVRFLDDDNALFQAIAKTDILPEIGETIVDKEKAVIGHVVNAIHGDEKQLFLQLSLKLDGANQDLYLSDGTAIESVHAYV